MQASRSSLRLAASPAALERLREAPIIVRHARNRGVVRHLETIYYDTPERTLFAAGLSLKVERQGRRFIQSVRQHGARRGSGTGLAWKGDVAGAAPDLACLQNAGEQPPPEWLLELLSTSPLQPVFETRQRRHLRRLELPAALLDVAFDKGVIEAAAEREELSEIRLELRAGDAGALYDVGMRLLEVAPLRVTSTSTVLRGYALASGVAPAAQKAAASTMVKGFLVDDMIAAVLGGCLRHLQANQLAAEGGGVEGVHQMRVALRRLRTALSLLRREIPQAAAPSLATEAKWLADALGPARGWDVFLSSTLAGPERLSGSGCDFEGLRRAAEAQHRAAHDSARAAIASPRAASLQMQLGQWIARRGWRNEVDGDGLGVLAEPAAMLAARALGRLHGKALRQGRHFRRLSAEERHVLRITLKKLRYAIEFFLPLAARPSEAGRFAARLSSLQDALGLDHDAATTQPLLDQVGQGSIGAGVHRAIGVVIGWQGRDGLAAGEILAKRWRRLKAVPLFWTGAESSL